MNSLPFTGRPDFGFYLAFQDPNDSGVTPVYIDFTTQLRAAGALSRGAQYELGQTLAADPTVILRDVQEFLNSANSSSPYFPNVDSYRRVLWMGTWPNTPIGNLFNSTYWGITGTVDPNLGPRDPSFESYTLGQAVPWISALGGTNPVVGNVTPNSGTQDLTYAVVGSATRQGIAFDMRCMPGRYYTLSMFVRQSSASTQQLIVDATVGASTSTTGAYVRLSQTFLATQPEHIAFLLTTGTAVAGTVLVDGIQMEQAPALNGNPTMQFTPANWTPHGCTIARSNRYAYQPEYSTQLTPDGVSATPFFESDRAVSVAVAGQVYIASGWAYSPTGTGANTADVRVNFYTAANVLISNPAGTPVALAANTWTFITTRFTAPAGTAFVTVLATLTGTPAAANAPFFDLVQVVSTIPGNLAPVLNGNPSFESGTTGWTATGGVIDQSTVYFHDGTHSGRLTPDGVSATVFAEDARAPVVTGQSYTASGWIYSVAGTGANTAGIRVNWYDAGGIYLSTSSAAESAIPANAPTFVTNTFTAPASAAFGGIHGIINSSPAASNVIYLDMVALASTAPVPFTTIQPTVFPIMANFAERFEKLWLDGEYTGYVQIPCVDALVPLASTKIPTEYATAVAATAPDYWWTLGQQDLSGRFYIEHNGGPTMSAVAGSGTPYTGLVSPGAASGVVGDPGSTGATVSGATATNQGALIRSGFLNIPSSGPTWALTMAFWCTFTDTTNTFGFAALSNKNGNMSAILRQGTFDLHPFSGTVYIPAGGGSDTGTTDLTYADGQAHFFVMTNSLAAGNFTTNLFVDGAVQATRIQSALTVFGTNSPNFAFTALELASGNFGFDPGDGVNGVYAHAKVWRRAITSTEVASLYQAGKNAFTGETSGARVARHFTIGQYPAPYRISANTTSIMGPPSYIGSIDLGTDTANSAVAEGGHFWIAPDGAPVFESRTDRWLRLNPLWTVGNTTGLTHFAAPSYSVDPQFVYANVQLTRSGGAVAVGGSAADIATATKRYFGRTYTAPGALDLSTDAQAQDLANFTFYTHNRTFQRIAVLTFYPYADLSWAFAFGVEVGNRIRVTFFTPAANGGTGFTNTADFFVENVTHDDIDADAATWSVALLLSPIGGATPPTLQPFVLNSATLGVLNQNILGW